MTNLEIPLPVRFYFDPVCPWTWATSRWFVDAADRRDITIHWRNLSLEALHRGDRPFRARPGASASAHRVIAALVADEREDLVGAFYLQWGRGIFHDGVEPTPQLVHEIADAIGAGGWTPAADEPAWDDAVGASTDHALEIVGTEVGSPVLSFGDPEIGIFGPIVAAPPTGDEADCLFDCVVGAARVGDFYELKRGRTNGLSFGPRP
jgi:2-hydroxychromene-2-carboxylate isomerase